MENGECMYPHLLAASEAAGAQGGEAGVLAVQLEFMCQHVEATLATHGAVGALGLGVLPQGLAFDRLAAAGVWASHRALGAIVPLV